MSHVQAPTARARLLCVLALLLIAHADALAQTLPGTQPANPMVQLFPQQGDTTPKPIFKPSILQPPVFNPNFQPPTFPTQPTFPQPTFPQPTFPRSRRSRSRRSRSRRSRWACSVPSRRRAC
jgi:hypothetical protein